MKILAWNCRGLCRPSAIRSLRGKIKNHSPDVMFLSETKTTSTVATVIMNNLGFFFMVHVPPSSTKGGLLLTWKTGVELECFLTTVNTITVWCYSDPSNNPWILSCIYGPPYRSHRDRFWDQIMKIGENYSGPWLCIGDFNMILDQSEKLGGLLYASSSKDSFRTFMNTFGMVD